MASISSQTEKILSDDYSVKILEATNEFKSISEISKECNIPLVSTYRRIHTLHENKFLEARGYLIDSVRFLKYKRRTISKYGQNNPKVKKILCAISEKPGICYTELMETTGFPNGTLSYYLSNMLKDFRIIAKRTKRRTWFFLPQTESAEIDLIINLRKETSKKILVFLLERNKATFKEIRAVIKKSPSTTSLSLTHLIDLGFVSRKSGVRPHYQLTDRKRIHDTIKKIEPNILDNLKDRFEDTFSYL